MTRPSRKNAARPARGRRNLSAVSAAELQAELARGQKRIHALTRRHERLSANAAALRAETTALGGQMKGLSARKRAASASRSCVFGKSMARRASSALRYFSAHCCA